MRVRVSAVRSVAALLIALGGPIIPYTVAESHGVEPMTQDSEVDGVSVELVSAKRTSGDTVTVQFKFHNQGTGDARYYSDVGLSSTDNLIEHVYLVDADNKKKYLIVKDSDGNPLGTKLHLFSLKAGKSKAAWAKFPAPATGVTKISVYVPGAPPFEDVPLAE